MNQIKMPFRHAKVCFFSLSLILFFGGCSVRAEEPATLENPHVSAVQKAILPFDRSITIGGAFAHYKYFRGVKWKETEPINGRTFVEVIGDLDAERLFSALRRPAYDLDLDTQDFVKNHDLRQVEEQWKSKIAHMALTYRFQLNADNSIEPLGANFQEEGRGRVYYFGNDAAFVIRMVYRNSMPIFILRGFVHPSDGRP